GAGGMAGHVRDAFTIGAERDFEQDPRFGLCVLAEIASRALSPAVNDAGTAIDVIGRGVRLLTIWAQESGKTDAEENPPCPRVRTPAFSASDMFEDIFAPIARDGADNPQVLVRLQKALGALARVGGQDF